jgi:hypothetical protein
LAASVAIIIDVVDDVACCNGLPTIAACICWPTGYMT